MTDKVENEEKIVEKSKFAKDLCFDKIVWIFMISCIVGFLVETLWCLIKHGYIESRQSLVWGPFSVAYGMGAVVLTLALYKVKDAPVWCIVYCRYNNGIYLLARAGNCVWLCCVGLQQNAA